MAGRAVAPFCTQGCHVETSPEANPAWTFRIKPAIMVGVETLPRTRNQSMGLTIHYSLKLPAKTLLPQVKQRLGALRQACLDIPFAEVGELMEFMGETECNFDLRDREDPVRWFLCQADTIVHFKYDRAGKPVPVQNWADGSYGRSVLPEHVVGFSTYPGSGCEECNVGLSQFPRTVSIRNRWSQKDHRIKVADGDGWRWHSFCKTQYAREHGLENFLRCHLSVVAMLDCAKRIGFDVVVNDEGHYWQTRNLETLVREIGSWDQMIAALGGSLKDAVGNTGMAIESPIFARKDFEQLELKGQALLPPAFGKAVRSLVETTALVRAEKPGN
jgi:hypothetical protein